MAREGRDRDKRNSRAAGKSAARKARPRRGPKLKVGKHGGHVPGKAAIAAHAPVPETDTGGRGENPKADGRSTVKELGKMAP